MPPADAAYHVVLDGKGYILVDQSYIRRSQIPFTPRFSTGAYGYGDLSFWQFLVQEAWDGGQGQTDFSNTAKIQESNGWTFGGFRGIKRPRLSGGYKSVSLGASFQAPKTDWLCVTGCVLADKGDGNAGLENLSSQAMTISATDSSSVDGTFTNLRTVGASQMAIDQVKAIAVSVMNRGAPGNVSPNTGRFLGFLYWDGTNVHAKVQDIKQNNVWDSALLQGLNPSPGLFIQIAADTLLAVCIGNLLSAAGPVGGFESICFERIAFPAASWVGPTVKTTQSGGIGNVLVPTFAFDSNASLYFASCGFRQDGTAFGEANNPMSVTEQIGSGVMICTSTDLLLTGGTNVTTIVPYPRMIITGLVAISGTVYIIGSRINRVTPNSTEYQDIVVKYPNTVIWENRRIKTAPNNMFPGLPKAVFQVNAAEAIFITESSLGSYCSVMRIMPNDVVEEAAALPFIQGSTTSGQQQNTYAAVIANGLGYMALDLVNKWAVQTFADNGTYGALAAGETNIPSIAPRILELSAFGANTSGIQKSLYKIILELADAPPVPGETFIVQVNDQPFASFRAEDMKQIGLAPSPAWRIELNAPAETVAAAFSIKLIVAGTSQWRGAIKRIAIQYVPVQLKKHAWGMALRVEHSQRLLNDQRDRREAGKMLTDLELAWKKNIPINYKDLDGQTYSVIITDMSERQPIIATNVKKREYIVSLELLEV